MLLSGRLIFQTPDLVMSANLTPLPRVTQPVGLSAAVPPASWEIQEALDVSTFSTYALVYDMLRVFEARLAPYYAISEVRPEAIVWH